MSKICYLVLPISFSHQIKFRKETIDLFSRCGVYIFTDLEFDYEPIWEYIKESFVISLADNPQYNNCEMLFLEDDHFSNGRYNDIPFIKRMSLLAEALKKVLNITKKAEIYIGVSGDEYEDFEIVQSDIDDFPQLMDEKYNDYIIYKSLHFIFNS